MELQRWNERKENITPPGHRRWLRSSRPAHFVSVDQCIQSPSCVSPYLWRHTDPSPDRKETKALLVTFNIDASHTAQNHN